MRTYPNGNKVFYAPRNFSINTIEEFLYEFEIVFNWKNKSVPNVFFNFSQMKKINMVGLLLIYKIIDFTYNNNCFKKPEINGSDMLESEWHKYKFWDLINAYISNNIATDKAYRDLKVTIEEQFIIAPQALLRNSSYTHTSLQNEFYPKISKYYSGDEKIVTNILTCFSEVLLNFWEHAVADTKSIILAGGNKAKVEIACADTGKGIISTLKSFFPDLSDEEILLKSLEQGITSKNNTFHMGYGLWIVDQIISNNNSRLHIYCEGVFYKNDYGKKTTGKTGYWHGTIIYINLDISKPLTPADFNLVDNSKFENQQINFI